MTPLMSSLAAIPTLSEMAALTYEDLPRLLRKQGQLSTEVLPKYGLGWFRHTRTGLIFLGLTGPSVSDHSRWILCWDPAETAVWYGVRAEGVPHPRGISVGGMLLYSAPYNATFLYSYTWQLDNNLERLKVQAALLGRAAPSLPLMVAYSRVAPDISIPDAARILRYEPEQLHQMLHHYDAWAAANPEFLGMPRDLVMRAHGLGFYTGYRYV